MPHQQRRPLDILLHDILILWSVNLPGIQRIFLLLCLRKRILLGRFNTLLYFQILVHFLLRIFLILVQLEAQLLNFLADEDSSALGATFWLADVDDDGVFLRLCFSHFSVVDFLLALIFLLFWVFLNIVEFRWVHPCFGKEFEMVRKILLKPFEMHAQGALSANVVHAQKMIYTLCVTETAEELRRHAAICPKDVPVVRIPILIDDIIWLWSSFLLFLFLLLLLIRIPSRFSCTWLLIIWSITLFIFIVFFFLLFFLFLLFFQFFFFLLFFRFYLLLYLIVIWMQR